MEELKGLSLAAKAGDISLSPWIELIMSNDLFTWWRHLDDISEGGEAYTRYVDDKIHLLNDHESFNCCASATHLQ